ncbi:hypothetical protein DPMN_100064 [Dreissena polymorpha]|uniref:Uncharacterized protein n=1 Tax=Dreissena polymorpha TaxID=45954 RepID=A0A9D4LHI3_DREPO|nr:hypothetical protein DPMN_100064 [Dreissena polymorpha]
MARQRPTRIPGLVMGPCLVKIDRIVIREVQYQLEVNRLKSNFVLVWPMWAGRPRIDRIVIRIVQYQLEVNRCRNEEIIVKGNFVWVPRIDRIVTRKVHNCGWVSPMWVGRFRIDRIVMHIKCNFGLVWSMCAGRPRIDRIVIREVQDQFEVNRCRNEEVNFQGSSAYSVGGDSGQDGQTDGRTDGRRR